MTDVLDTRHRLLYTTKGDHNEMVDKCVACQSVVHGTYPLVSVKSHKQQNQKHREVYAILPNSLLRETAGCDHCRKLIWPPELLDMASAPSNIAHGSEHFMLSESGKYVVKCRPDQAKYKSLLCIDGGGIRGILPAMVLKELEDQIKEVIMEKSEHPKQQIQFLLSRRSQLWNQHFCVYVSACMDASVLGCMLKGLARSVRVD